MLRLVAKATDNIDILALPSVTSMMPEETQCYDDLHCPQRNHEHALIFAAASVLLQVFVRYRRYAPALKFLTLVLFLYVATAFTVHIPWGQAFARAVWPAAEINRDYLLMVVAVLGTTISPYEDGCPEHAAILAPVANLRTVVGTARERGLDLRHSLWIGAARHQETETMAEHLFPVVSG